MTAEAAAVCAAYAAGSFSALMFCRGENKVAAMAMVLGWILCAALLFGPRL